MRFDDSSSFSSLSRARSCRTALVAVVVGVVASAASGLVVAPGGAGLAPRRGLEEEVSVPRMRDPLTGRRRRRTPLFASPASSSSSPKNNEKNTKKKPKKKKGSKAKAKKLEELREVRGATDAATQAWADKIASRLEANAFADTENELLKECKAAERDLFKIEALVKKFPGGGYVDGNTDWRLVWARSDAAVGEIGTGLHRVPLARLEDIFLSFTPSAVRLSEVVRVIGPFPNVKNLLFGSWALEWGGKRLDVSYGRGYDGTGKSLDGEARDVAFEVCHASDRVIVLGCPDLGDVERLVFEREDDLSEELSKLRVPVGDNDAFTEDELADK